MLAFLHCFNGCEGERNWMETHRSVSQRAGDVVGSFFFSGAVTLSNAVDGSQKVTMYEDCPAGSVQVTYVDWRGKRTYHVYQVSPTGCSSI
jgi:hypothetical protein